MQFWLGQIYRMCYLSVASLFMDLQTAFKDNSIKSYYSEKRSDVYSIFFVKDKK